MTTTERPSESSTKPKYLTEEYEVVRDGQTLRCQQVEYMGTVYEICDGYGGDTDVFEELFAGRRLQPGEEGYAELVEYLNQFLTSQDEPVSE